MESCSIMFWIMFVLLFSMASLILFLSTYNNMTDIITWYITWSVATEKVDWWAVGNIIAIVWNGNSVLIINTSSYNYKIIGKWYGALHVLTYVCIYVLTYVHMYTPTLTLHVIFNTTATKQRSLCLAPTLLKFGCWVNTLNYWKTHVGVMAVLLECKKCYWYTFMVLSLISPPKWCVHNTPY